MLLTQALSVSLAGPCFSRASPPPPPLPAAFRWHFATSILLHLFHEMQLLFPPQPPAFHSLLASSQPLLLLSQQAAERGLTPEIRGLGLCISRSLQEAQWGRGGRRCNIRHEEEGWTVDREPPAAAAVSATAASGNDGQRRDAATAQDGWSLRQRMEEKRKAETEAAAAEQAVSQHGKRRRSDAADAVAGPSSPALPEHSPASSQPPRRSAATAAAAEAPPRPAPAPGSADAPVPLASYSSPPPAISIASTSPASSPAAVGAAPAVAVQLPGDDRRPTDREGGSAQADVREDLRRAGSDAASHTAPAGNSEPHAASADATPERPRFSSTGVTVSTALPSRIASVLSPPSQSTSPTAAGASTGGVEKPGSDRPLCPLHLFVARPPAACAEPHLAYVKAIRSQLKKTVPFPLDAIPPRTAAFTPVLANTGRQTAAAAAEDWLLVAPFPAIAPYPSLLSSAGVVSLLHSLCSLPAQQQLLPPSLRSPSRLPFFHIAATGTRPQLLILLQSLVWLGEQASSEEALSTGWLQQHEAAWRRHISDWCKQSGIVVKDEDSRAVAELPPPRFASSPTNIENSSRWDS